MHWCCTGARTAGVLAASVHVAIDPPRNQLEDPLHDEARRDPAGTARRCVRRLVRYHNVGPTPVVVDPVGTPQMRNRVVRNHQAVEARQSHVDEDPVQRRIFADLDATGYDGWLSIEPHIKAAIHAGQDVDDTGEARTVWVEFARRLEKLVSEL